MEHGLAAGNTALYHGLCLIFTQGVTQTHPFEGAAAPSLLPPHPLPTAPIGCVVWPRLVLTQFIALVQLSEIEGNNEGEGQPEGQDNEPLVLAVFGSWRTHCALKGTQRRILAAFQTTARHAHMKTVLTAWQAAAHERKKQVCLLLLVGAVLDRHCYRLHVGLCFRTPSIYSPYSANLMGSTTVIMYPLKRLQASFPVEMEPTRRISTTYSVTSCCAKLMQL